jgi:molybdopterin biosynthesis enzyme
MNCFRPNGEAAASGAWWADLDSHELLRPVLASEADAKPGETRWIYLRLDEPLRNKPKRRHAIVWSFEEVWAWIGQLRARPIGPRW